AIGPSLAIWLSQHYTFDAVFLTAAIAGGIALFAALFFRMPERTPSEEEHRQLRSWDITTFVDIGALKMGIVVGLAGFAVSGVIGFIAVHSEVLGHAEAASTFFIVYALSTLLARLITGRIQDRRGDNI